MFCEGFYELKRVKNQTLKGMYGATQRRRLKQDLMQELKGKSKEACEWSVEVIAR